MRCPLQTANDPYSKDVSSEGKEGWDSLWGWLVSAVDSTITLETWSVVSEQFLVTVSHNIALRCSVVGLKCVCVCMLKENDLRSARRHRCNRSSANQGLIGKSKTELSDHLEKIFSETTVYWLTRVPLNIKKIGFLSASWILWGFLPTEFSPLQHIKLK